MMLTEEPPPLEDCSGFLRRLHSDKLTAGPGSKTSIQTASRRSKLEDSTSLVDIGEDKRSLAILTSPSISNCPTNSCKSKPLRKGFLNSQSTKSSTKDKIPFITAKKPLNKVPEFLHVDMKDHPEEKLRKEMQDLLKPTEELLGEVMKNGDIKVGLEDPEIMRAIQEIASNPAAIEKHKHNPKVSAFYSRMGKLMGDQIEKKIG